ncbi:MAG: hypothetical protein A2268_16150 [Candidatus Raymondbacteria bacterium RifOxyA12_full_50_37]|uniref:Uncharacterized protein n=1 Tax=Candidatus Raymondbacteria bacterium RIFOXYD12_FULL_49_13 TaxID=1817890 RepID=A0A1F7FBQ1_UNCRA|nr:MAG: hypothetical protein A2268_16150 [Candidatus Raymondbacteria bacterium RifOxyA12_full_50_37]OGJ87491.1 MAG: hypothetical protein A2350_13835 [Candidatus Raymondbacteria bacterium RifOxyB12_full_50_8]OGJ94329.1 MAG: hypothetical protein A2248_14345 [Candidatus Raymondbacteria bacterium RIFOXYA2_FULL_49_16]OGJ95271.1 MAG: hypothetical protein A2453_05770 [Candidatus Raymondbacteria bacterium RIFOXYC2_FULL_50_21]OGK04110.1 MAG: hypothetical protein A2519_19615 [Candidatus Raymondbacteria b
MQYCRLFIICALLGCGALQVDAQRIDSKGGLYWLYREGYLDGNAYAILYDMCENRRGLCVSLDGLALVPGVSQEELSLLENACGSAAVDWESIPRGLRVKIAPFVLSPDEGTPAAVRVAYDFSRNLDDTLTMFEKEHGLGVFAQAAGVSFSAEQRSDAFGNGYFQSRSIAVSPACTGLRATLGNFSLRKGRGITLGGAPQLFSNQAYARDFPESALFPRTTEFNGLSLSLSLQRCAPFAFVSAARERTAAGRLAGLAGGGCDIRQGAAYAGIAVAGMRLPGQGNGNIDMAAVGAYGGARTGQGRVDAEVSYADSGAAISIDASQRSGRLGAGLGYAAYGAGYCNPAGRGQSAFSRRSVYAYNETDSALITGARTSEQYAKMWATWEARGLSFGPAATAARSSLSRENRYCLEWREEWTGSGASYTLTGIQGITSVRTDTNSSDSPYASGLYAKRFINGGSLEAGARYADAGDAQRVSARVCCTFPAGRGIALSPECLFISSRSGKGHTFEGAFSLEESMSVGKAGHLKAFGVLSFGADEPLFSPAAMGLSLIMALPAGSRP